VTASPDAVFCVLREGVNEDTAVAQIKIYGLRTSFEKHRRGLSRAIHSAVVEALSYPLEKKFHRFIALEKPDFIFPDDRSDSYTIIEISMFQGRSVEARKALIRALFANIERECQIAPQDVEITITETPKENWGIRGKCGDELALNYKVSV
jgi:phenylpyruvate tautomerase PptA (4-oxalocrotonate tautomerase family)